MAEVVAVSEQKYDVIEAPKGTVLVTDLHTSVSVIEDNLTLQVVEQPTQIIVPPDVIVEARGDGALSIVEVGVMGPQGPRGPQGLPGPTSTGGGGSVGIAGIGVVNTLFAINLPAGGSVDLDSSIIEDNSTGYLLRVDYSSSVACKWEIKTKAGAVEILQVTRMTSGLTGSLPGDTWQTLDHNLFYQLGNGTDRFFRVTVTNLDAFNAANIYATIYWDEV